MHSLGKTLLLFDLLHFVLQGQICLLLQVALDFLFFNPVPYNEKDMFLAVSSRRSCRSSYFSFSFFSITGQGIDMDYCDTEWFALEINRYHSVVFEFLKCSTKYCISDSFVHYVGYSILSTGFLPIVVNIMVF